jgi:hypothetical protein
MVLLILTITINLSLYLSLSILNINKLFIAIVTIQIQAPITPKNQWLEQIIDQVKKMLKTHNSVLLIRIK